MKLPYHEATTAQLGAVYPFASSKSLPCSEVLVGKDLLGGAFVYDPFQLYAAGVLTNPNAVVIGQIGRGKSALIKTYLYRQAAFGRRLVVLDPKGEYGALARSLGVEPLCLFPGGLVRVNPLEVAAHRTATVPEQFRNRLGVLATFSQACLGRPLMPVEHAALELALSTVSDRRVATLCDVIEALLSPTGEVAASIHSSAEVLRSDGRDVALELRRFVAGELSGMFDAPTSPGVDLSASALVVDVSALYASPALGALLACLVACLEGGRGPGEPTVFVIDEAWSVLANLGAARFLQSSWKLARARGVANVAVVHRLSDLEAAGGAGSEQVKLAQGLLADCETVVCYAQSPSEKGLLVELLGLDAEQADLVTRLRRGVALWRVAGRSFLVEHHLSPAERHIVDTDAAMVS